MVTRARQRQQDALEDEEHLRQEQDGAVITMLDSVDSGVQAEGTEDLETEEGKAEVPGGNQRPEGSEIADQTENGQAEMLGENQVEEQCTEGSVMADPTEEVEE